MANLLYRLGGAAARRHWLVLGAWVAVLIVVGGLAAVLAKPTTSSITIPGTESQRAIALLAKKFPGTGGASARIVVAAPAGHTLTEPAYTALATKALAELAKAPAGVLGTLRAHFGGNGGVVGRAWPGQRCGGGLRRERRGCALGSPRARGRHFRDG
jgi:hypothetical protein